MIIQCGTRYAAQRTARHTVDERWRRRAGEVVEVAFDHEPADNLPQEKRRTAKEDGLKERGDHACWFERRVGTAVCYLFPTRSRRATRNLWHHSESTPPADTCTFYQAQLQHAHYVITITAIRGPRSPVGVFDSLPPQGAKKRRHVNSTQNRKLLRVETLSWKIVTRSLAIREAPITRRVSGPKAVAGRRVCRGKRRYPV